MASTTGVNEQRNNQGVVPGTSRYFDSFFPPPEQTLQLQQQSSIYSPSTFLPDDPAAALQLRNAIHQAACNSLIYNGRWRYCVGVWDEGLLEWLVDAAAPGNFWTPKTYLVVATSDNENENPNGMEVHFDFNEHPIWQEWEGTKPLRLSSTVPAVDNNTVDNAVAAAASSENVKKLRSLASRILPRLSNSGQRATDLPVFDTLIVTSCQLQSLLQEVAVAAAKEKAASEAHSHHHNNHHSRSNRRKKKKKRKRQKNQDMPWVVPVSSSSTDALLLLPSLKVLQAAKQLIVVQTTETVEFDETLLESSSVEELFPQALWLETSECSRAVVSNDVIYQENGVDQGFVPPQTPEAVPWGTW